MSTILYLHKIADKSLFIINNLRKPIFQENETQDSCIEQMFFNIVTSSRLSSWPSANFLRIHDSLFPIVPVL